MIICILGRQPRLAAAELESLYGSEAVRLLPDQPVALVSADDISLELGGTIKTARLIDTIPAISFSSVIQHLKRRLPQYIADMPAEGKLKLGLSVYGLSVSLPELTRASLFLKQTLKRTGRSVRSVPNSELALSSAQVIHNQLTSPLGLELILVRDGDHTLIGRTFHEQDITAYTLRDRGRPRRDPFVGMLPPKLAQIMIHLAARGTQKAPAEGSDNTTPTLLDPFCGTGVVLQEALLEGYQPYGTDLSERMVRFTRDNLNWLIDTHHVTGTPYYEIADATNHSWRQPIDLVVCEAYLGQPMSQEPPREKLEAIIHECNTILRGFLTNIAPQLAPGTPLCVAAPAWFVAGGVRHLPCLSDLAALGFRRHTFDTANDQDLIYHRDDQIVGRELLVLTKAS